MPRLVDHEVRRRQITTAVRRVIVTGGMRAVTFQSVAAEAGMSVRLVQYYFGTKREFLLATNRSVMEDVGARFARQWEALGENVSPREAIRAVLTELLPLDDRRREEAVVLGAFGTAAIAGEDLGTEDTLVAVRLLVSLIADQLERAHRLRPRADPASIGLDAELIAAAIAGIAQGMVQGHSTGPAALDVVDRLLDLTVGQ